MVNNVQQGNDVEDGPGEVPVICDTCAHCLHVCDAYGLCMECNCEVDYDEECSSWERK